MYALVIYWLIFWQKFLRNPYLLCTSEIMTTNFPHWIWMGRKWRAEDSIYYRFPASIPFMSMWYWPNVCVSYISKFLCIDKAFTLYTWFILGHYLLASLIAYKVLGLFGALTLTYAGYCIKPQTPSFVYTMCWMPGMLIGGWFGAFSCFMAITGGYWPILVYFMPVAVILNPWCLIGVIPCIPMLITFKSYWKKSIRHNQQTDRKEGRIPAWRLLDLVKPQESVSPVNGVHYPEVAMYMGIAPLFIFHFSSWQILLVCSLLILTGILPSIQRIPGRVLYISSFCISVLATQNFQNHLLYTNQLLTSLLLIQFFLLLKNSSIYPSFPFSQWWKRPSDAYPQADYTGYLTNTKLNDYKGGFCLKESA